MLMLEEESRKELWADVISVIEEYITQVRTLPVSPPLDPDNLRKLLHSFDFDKPSHPQEALQRVVGLMKEHQVHTPHPMYFGLFNPAPSTMGIAADALVAAFNPQMAAWSHNPIAAEVERYLVKQFCGRFGFPAHLADGTFCSGGAEANHTALLTALVHAFPAFDNAGVRGLSAQPIFYTSNQTHHSFLKVARFCGIGTDSVHQVSVNEYLQLDPAALENQIKKDKAAGLKPFLLVATAGSTGTGVTDDLGALADIAQRESLWFHTDAAWGGAAILLPEGQALFRGIDRSDSITFDAHKWLSVPMGAGMYLTQHPEILSRTCRITTAGYMPKEGEGLDFVDPYSHSLQWSRRFTGLKLFLTLACAGWKGYENTIRFQWNMGELLRIELASSGWKIVNNTPLPLVCFIDGLRKGGEDPSRISTLLQAVLATGKAWISLITLPDGTAALRACITNYRTTEDDVRNLVAILNECREAAAKTRN